MTKKDRNTIGSLFSLVIIAIGFLTMDFFSQYMPSVVFLFGFIILATFVGSFVAFILQNKSTKKKKKTKSKTKSIKEIPFNRRLSDNEIIKLPLEKINWWEFERLCYLYFKSKGYKPVETSEGADGGVDLIITDPVYRERVAIQIKHYISGKSQVNVNDIRSLYGAKLNHNCSMADIITSGSFTNPSLTEADKRRIKTYGEDWVRNNIDKWRANKLKK